jgi:hypothetical protein
LPDGSDQISGDFKIGNDQINELTGWSELGSKIRPVEFFNAELKEKATAETDCESPKIQC